MDSKSCQLSFRERDVFGVMPTGYDKHFKIQLFATALMIREVRKGKHLDTVVKLTCPLTSTIWEQVKEGKIN